MANDNVIENSQLTSIFIYMKTVGYDLSSRKLWHTKWHLDVMCCTIQSYGCTVLHLIGTHLALVSFSLLP